MLFEKTVEGERTERIDPHEKTPLMRRFYFGENCPRRTARSKGFSITRLPYQRTAPKNCPPKSYPPTSLFCFIYKRGYLDKNFIQKIQTSSFLQKVRIVFRRSCFYKKERPMALMLMAPAHILRQQKICGKTCGAKGVPPKPLKGSHTSASLVRCQRHRASELRTPPHFGLTPSCAAASECFCKQASRCRGDRANRQPTSSFCYFRLFRRLWFASPLHHEKRHRLQGAFSRGGDVPSKSEPNFALISSIVAVFEPSL